MAGKDQDANGGSWVARTYSTILVSNAIVSVLGLVQGILIARWLGPTAKGQVFLLVLTATTLGWLLSATLGYSLQYHVSAGKLGGRAALRLAVSYATLVGAFGTGFLSLLTSLLGWDGVLSTADRNLVVLGLILVPTDMLLQALLPLALSLDSVRPRCLIEIGISVTGLILLLTLVGVADTGVRGAGIAYVLSNAAGTGALTLMLYRRTADISSSPEPSMRSILWFGIRQHPATVLARTVKRFDQYVVLAVLGTSGVGVYSVASSLAEAPLLVVRSLHGVILSFVGSSEPARAARVTAQISRLIMPLLVVGYLGYALLVAVALPTLFGPAFLPAYWPFVLLLIATLGIAFYTIVAGYLTGSGLPQFTAQLLLPATAVNIVLSLLLVPSIGLVGNAWATVVASTVMFLVSLAYFRRFSHLRAKDALVPQRQDLHDVIQLVRQERQHGESSRRP